MSPQKIFLHLLLIFLSVTSLAFSKSTDGKIDEQSSKNILYRETTNKKGEYLLKLLSTDNNQEQIIGTITGSPAWSPNGHFLALGCPMPGYHQLCLITTSAIPLLRIRPMNLDSAPLLLKKVNLPKECNLDFSLERKSEIQSLSWSPDGKKLAVVCSNARDNSTICILDLLFDGFSCWNEFKDGIARALWHPSGGKLIISYGEFFANPPIFEVSLDGKNAIQMAMGWSPEISPDGQKMAFLRWYKPEKSIDEKWMPKAGETIFPGIAMVDIKTKKAEWLYRPPAVRDLTHISFIILCDELKSGTCRLSWASDGQSITFPAKYVDGYVWKLYQLNILSGDTRILADNNPNRLSEPDWEP